MESIAAVHRWAAGGPMITALALSRRLDELLRVIGHPDYPGALNGLQCDHRGPVHRLAAAVDASQRSIRLAAEQGANFLIVHHGLFWNGPQPITGSTFDRLRLLLDGDLAVYSAHLPLDSHPQFGNNVLFARQLGLTPTRPFASFQGVAVGAAGEDDLATDELIDRAARAVRQHGGAVRVSAFDAGRRTHRWAVCTGAGASTDTLREAEALGIDTLIVGEGPHHTAVEAPERGIVIVYAGHYATETFGVAALTEAIASEFGLPWGFISAPTGL